MAIVHIIQTYDHVRDALAAALQEHGYTPVCHDITDMVGLVKSFRESAEPVAVITSQMDSKSSFPGNPYVANEVAMMAKTVTDKPSLTIVYSSIDAESDHGLSDTPKDTVVRVHKGMITSFDMPQMLKHLDPFFKKSIP